MKFNITNDTVKNDYERSKQVYEDFGIDTDNVLKQMENIHLSLHCWQGDDVGGFEKKLESVSGGGILATGNYPGKARNGEELRLDLDKAFSLIPGNHRVNLHAIYAETNNKFVERDNISTEHFTNWINWAKKNNLGIDFNGTFFAHDKANSNYTLSSKDKEIRSFWIRHAKKCREIAADIGKELGKTCINNIWIPDGSKDLPAEKISHRQILKESLDEILQTKLNKNHILDAVESKLFGIGVEAYVVGSHEFYMGYAMKNDVMLCLDAGHFHPTESIADKISSILTFSDRLLLHVSRGVRWDSDHVVILNDDLLAIAQEVVRCNAINKINFALDYFDASINRITAWVVGSAALKSLLLALLEPKELIQSEENGGNLGNRLAYLEEIKSLPYGAIWNKYCLDKGVPVGAEWINSCNDYEKSVLSKRV